MSYLPKLLLVKTTWVFLGRTTSILYSLNSMNPTTLPPSGPRFVISKRKKSGGFIYKKRDIRHRPLLRRKSLYMPKSFISQPQSYKVNNFELYLKNICG